jgi:hypothetical protein
MSKKGDLSLSINAIVILILAVTLLSLGLTFITKVFGGATGELQKSLQGISEDRKEQLKSKCNEDLCLEFTSITIPRNKMEPILMVLNNKLDCDVTATISANNDQCQIVGVDNPSAAQCRAVELKAFTSQKVRSKQKEVLALNINPKNSADTTTYRYEITAEGPCTTGGGSENRMDGSEYLDVIVQ